MVNRRLAKGSRSSRKKKEKTAKKATIATAIGAIRGKTKKIIRTKIVNGKVKKQQNRFSDIEALRKQKSKLMRQQVKERMALKEHTHELEARKDRLRRGANAKTERREMAKYIRQLKQEQQVKHASELQNVEAELARLMEQREAVRAQHGGNEEDADWEDIGDFDEDDVGEEELQAMFAHLMA